MGGRSPFRIAPTPAQLMTALVDTSVLIAYLRGHRGAAELLEMERAAAPLHAREITRLEVLAGMWPAEEEGTRSLLSTLVWHRSTRTWRRKPVPWVVSGYLVIAPSTALTSPSPPPPFALDRVC